MVLSWRFFRHHRNQRTNPHTRQLGSLSRTLTHGFMDVQWQKERERERAVAYNKVVHWVTKEWCNSSLFRFRESFRVVRQWNAHVRRCVCMMAWLLWGPNNIHGVTNTKRHHQVIAFFWFGKFVVFFLYYSEYQWWRICRLLTWWQAYDNPYWWTSYAAAKLYWVRSYALQATSCLLFNYIRVPYGVATIRSFAFWDSHVTMNVMLWMHCHELGGQRPWSEDHVWSPCLTSWWAGIMKRCVNGLVIDDNVHLGKRGQSGGNDWYGQCMRIKWIYQHWMDNNECNWLWDMDDAHHHPAAVVVEGWTIDYSLHSEASWKKKVGKSGWSTFALDSKRDGRICNTFIGKTSLTGTILGVFISSHIMPFDRVQSSN